MLKKSLFFWPKCKRVVAAVTGPMGGVHSWYSMESKEHYGGLEIHYNRLSKPSYAGDTPDNANCWLTGECWHDGSSLAFNDKYRAIFETCGESGSWDWMFTELQSVYKSKLERCGEA